MFALEDTKAQKCSSTLSLTSALVVGVLSTPRLSKFTPRQWPGDRTEGWVGPRASTEGCGKSRSPLGVDPRTVQPVTSRYTNYNIPAHNIIETSRISPRGKIHRSNFWNMRKGRSFEKSMYWGKI